MKVATPFAHAQPFKPDVNTDMQGTAVEGFRIYFFGRGRGGGGEGRLVLRAFEHRKLTPNPKKYPGATDPNPET